MMTIRKALVFCLVLVTAQFSFAQDTELSPEQIETLNAARQEGNLLYSQRKYRDAIEAFDRALAIDSSLATTHFNVGLCHHRLRNYESALASLRHAVANQSNFGEARLEIAKVLFRMNRLEDSEREYVSIRADLSDSANIVMVADNMLAGAIATGYRNRAARALNQRAYDQALADAQHSVSLNPAEPAAHYYEAKAHQGLRNYDSAREAYQRVLEHAQDPTYISRAHVGLGLLSVRDARSAVRRNRTSAARRSRLSAVEHLRSAIEADSTNYIAFLNLGNTLYDLGRFQDAVQALTSAEQYGRRSYKAPLKLSDAYIRLGQFSNAAEAARRAIALQPRNATAHAFLAESLEEQGQLQGALDEYNNARRDPRWRERAVFKMKEICQQLNNCARYGIDPNED